MNRPPFSSDTYSARRQELAHALGSGVVLFLGNDEAAMNYADNPYPFRQDSTFLYYFGIDRPGLAAVIDLDEGRSTLFGNDLTIDEIVWMGPQPTVAEMAGWVGVEDTAPAKALDGVITEARKAERPVHYLSPYRPEHKMRLAGLLLRTIADAPGSSHGPSLALVRAVVAQRAVKSEEEIAEIEKAVEITAEMHRTAMRMAKPGMVEREIAAAVQEVAARHGGRLSFPSIITVHGETLHNHYHGNTLETGQLLLCDCGAEAPSRYAGDMSRTFPVDAKFSPRQREIYEIALDAHEAAVEALAPGVPYRDVHLTACRRIAAGLTDLGLMKGDPEAAVEAGAHALFFQCGTGHMMGLDVHDMENLGEDEVGYGPALERDPRFGFKSLRLARRLEPGFVLTVEPGIYFIPELIDLWRGEDRFTDFVDYDRVDEYRGFGGLRSEEDFVITENGARRLGPYVAKTVDEIEEIRRSSRV